jgi:hypothetical protein
LEEEEGLVAEELPAKVFLAPDVHHKKGIGKWVEKG